MGLLLCGGCLSHDSSIALKSAAFAPTMPFSGVIAVDVSAPRTQVEGAGFKFTRVTFNADLGEISMSQIEHESEPIGSHIDRCASSPKVNSTDGTLAAYCFLEFIAIQTVRVVDIGNGSEVLKLPLEKDELISGISWSPDSNAIAVLSVREQRHWGLDDTFRFLASHPVPYNAFSLRLFSFKPVKQLEIPEFVTDVAWGRGSVRWPTNNVKRKS
jgi:hypothetical protein